ncbi:unnamed protein product [Paramecium sonneborni]|uniref:TLDc domain-containing protein n=1 Tax=Paramecium sonneborni TaxID=65129 RepID=A0A8S1QWT8_9CILI|nr:unnamed protein product [Paramecium sonneborni]
MYKIPCYKHDGSYVQFINNDENKTQFICDQCQQDLFDLNPRFNFQHLININRALKSPEFLISKLDVSGEMKNFFDQYSKYDEVSLNKQFKEFESLIKDIQDGFKKILQELQQSIKLFLDSKQTIRQDLEQLIKFNEFKSFIMELEQLGDSINPQAIEQAESDVHKYFQNITINFKQKLRQKFQENVETRIQKEKNEESQIFPEFKKLQSSLQDMILKHKTFSNQLQPDPPNDYILSNQFYERIVEYIQKQLNIQIYNSKLIYSGHKEDLNTNQFWNKCNNKANLLMIFKSSKNRIFGGYSPCKWVHDKQGTYVSDQTLSTFLFSQDNNEIYQLKNECQQFAIYCNEKYGPIFGGGHDLFINSNFVDGFSKLGHSFSLPSQKQKVHWNAFNQYITSTDLFGQETSNIVECQIFELIFQ